MKHRKKEDYKTSTWAGGTTTELCLFPEGGSYAERRFDLRISSATCDLLESQFTPLPDFQRELMILDGEIHIFHKGNGGERDLVLPPEALDSFSGADETRSVGRCTDFNVIYRAECYEVEVLPIRNDHWKVRPEDGEKLFVYLLKNGSLKDEDGRRTDLSAQDSLFFNGECAELSFAEEDFNAVLVRIVSLK